MPAAVWIACGPAAATLAVLAGLSPDYYSRLEQGRQANVSVEVLDALARALRLDDVERGEDTTGLGHRGDEAVRRAGGRRGLHADRDRVAGTGCRH